MIYLDYAAATPVDPKVMTAMQPYFSDKFFNPSAAYAVAREVRADYNDAKHRIASIIGAKPAEIVITAGATESINLALHGVNGQIITTNIEHPAVLNNVANNTTIISVDQHGRVDPKNIKNAVTDETKLISIGYANNEIGTVQPIKQIAEIVSVIRTDRAERNIKMPLLFHTDASQVAGLLDINVARLGVDMMTLNAGKCYGPKQVGLLYVRAGVKIDPLVRGGGQELGLRSGTENVAGVVGFARALDIAEKKRKNETRRLGELRQNFIKFAETEIPDAVINGSKKYCLPNLINFSTPGVDGERLVFALDQREILVATGSACAANKGTRSHVLSAIGLSDEMADSSIRISMGRGTTIGEIEKLKKVLLEVIENERRIS